MSQGLDRLDEAEMRSCLLKRKAQTHKMVNELLSELEKYAIEDVAKLAPKERLTLYAQMIRAAAALAKAEENGNTSKDGNIIDVKHRSVFGNVLTDIRADA